MIFFNPFKGILSEELSCWVSNDNILSIDVSTYYMAKFINILYYKWECT